MKQYDINSLVVHPNLSGNSEVIVEVRPEEAGWDTISFQVIHLVKSQGWTAETGADEAAIIILSGQVDIDSNQGKWTKVGSRDQVFSGLPYALYLSRNTSFTVTAATDCEFAVARTPAMTQRQPKLITPDEINVEIRGGDHATRQINQIIPPGFPCDRLVVVEVYTPGGNWSSYPPHKHDVRKVSADGRILEADLDEIYYYKIDRPEGFAIQRLYTDPESPLQKAGMGFDASILVRNNDVALVPEGYHPVSSPPGYTTYYLNILAGSDQSLAAIDDPAYTWVKDSYSGRDPRVPIFPVKKTS